MARATAKTKKFRATLRHGGRPLHWTIIDIPFSVHEAWGTRGMLRVAAQVNGHTFRISLFPRRTGVHFMMINKQVQCAAGIAAGSTAQFTLTPDLAARTVKIPPELERIFRQEKPLRRFFDQLNYSTRKEFCARVAGWKNPASRVKHAEKMAELMISTMEAEHELPPFLRKMFAETPHAERGWMLMTPNQRRGHLMGIFYYQSLAARTRRTEKAIEAALQVAERKR